MKIRFDFKRECYILDLKRALIISAVLLGIAMLVCFTGGGTHIYSVLLLPRFAPSRAASVIFWTLAYFILGFAMEIFLSSRGCAARGPVRIRIFSLFGAIVLLGYLWFFIFFTANAFFWSFALCVLICVLNFLLVKSSVKICLPAAILFILCLVMNFYYMSVNFCVFILN